MLNKCTIRIGFALLSFGLSGLTSDAATWTVGKPNTSCPQAQYGTIAEAVDAASAGDVIEICPAMYPEQLRIAKPLTLRGISTEGVNRVLIQPLSLSAAGDLPFVAVIAVTNTTGVNIENLAIDAGNNGVSGCQIGLAGVHYYNASGTVANNAVFGARLNDPKSCPALFPGNGSAVQIDKDANVTGEFKVSVRNNSITSFTRNGVLVTGAGVTADIDGNSISGAGPSTGGFQFGAFLANGAVGRITDNMINMGTCGSLSMSDCVNLRSEGVVLRAAGDGTVIDGNSITNVQAGIFTNGANNAQITNNTVRNVDVLSGIHLQATTDSVIARNRILHVGPIPADLGDAGELCGVFDAPGTGSARNTIRDNTVNDAYCGVGYLTTDRVESGVYTNTLYSTLNIENYPNTLPPTLEPGQLSTQNGQ